MVTFNKETETQSSTLGGLGREVRGIVEDIRKPGSDPQETTYTRTRLAWGAVIAGTLTSLAILALASAFGAACDVPAYRGGTYGVGSMFWSIISSAVAFFFGGLVVEYLTRRGESRLGILHGMLAWVLAVNLMALMSLPGLGLFHSYVPWDLMRGAATDMPNASATAASWGVFLSLLSGMIAASVGGILGYFMFEKSRRA